MYFNIDVIVLKLVVDMYMCTKGLMNNSLMLYLSPFLNGNMVLKTMKIFGL